MDILKALQGFYGSGSDCLCGPDPEKPDECLPPAGIGAWSNSDYMNESRYTYGSLGTQDACQVLCGYDGSTLFSSTEINNGAGWSTGPDYGVARFKNEGTGTLDAGLGAGGSQFITESKKTDGVTWSSTNSLILGKEEYGLTGTLDAGLALDGKIQTIGEPAQLFDGVNWTTGGTPPIRGHRAPAAAGTQTNALVFGGAYGGAPQIVTQGYDGISFTPLNNMITGREMHVAFGSANSAYSVTGKTNATANSALMEEYTGITWSASDSMGYGINRGAASGLPGAGRVSGGQTTSNITSLTSVYNRECA